MLSTQEAFYKKFNGKTNVITPKVLGYFTAINSGYALHIEYSRGIGFEGDYIYGVTVLIESPKGELVHIFDWCESFHSSKAARKYIKDTIKEFKSLTTEEIQKLIGGEDYVS